LSPRPSVLIVDQSAEAREVLRTALQRTGTLILEAAGAQLGLELARKHQPDLIVLDLDAEGTGAGQLSDDFHDTVGNSCTPIVVLGTARRPATRLPWGTFVAKPYHFGPLVRKIEELLAGSR